MEEQIDSWWYQTIFPVLITIEIVFVSLLPFIPKRQESGLTKTENIDKLIDWQSIAGDSHSRRPGRRTGVESNRAEPQTVFKEEK